MKWLGAIGFLLTLAFAPATAAQARIEDAAWLAGRWVGEGLGGQLEETWAPPAGGQMVGHFRLTRNGAPVFYEIMLMEVTEGGVQMRVKHFNPDFTGWEERNEWVIFEPVSASETELAFSGLVLRREGEDQLIITIRLRYSETDVRDEVLQLRRAPL
ncbi:MAG: DUF6265 family protein [Hyphomonadaceae bacterium]